MNQREVQGTIEEYKRVFLNIVSALPKEVVLSVLSQMDRNIKKGNIAPLEAFIERVSIECEGRQATEEDVKGLLRQFKILI